jgi:inosose dehydratase
MDGAMTLRLASGPVSWGVDFADVAGNPPWDVVLDGIAAAGYAGTELGPLGYLPAHLAGELRARDLTLVAGFLFEPLCDPAHRAALLATARRVAARVAMTGGRFLLLIDLPSAGRTRTAGRSEAAPRLAADERAVLDRHLAELARIAAGHGLRALVHPHAGGHIEFEDEIDALPDAVGLCLDTGHCRYAGLDPTEAYRRWSDRVAHLHLKDIALDRVQDDFWSTVRAGAFRPLGAGDVDFGELLGTLEREGYAGWLTIEQDRVPGGDPVADLVAGRRHLEAIAA